MPSNVNISIRKKFHIFAGHKYHWSASSSNGKLLAAGRGYKEKDDVIHVLHVLFGPKFGGHKVLDKTGERG